MKEEEEEEEEKEEGLPRRYCWAEWRVFAYDSSSIFVMEECSWGEVR